MTLSCSERSRDDSHNVGGRVVHGAGGLDTGASTDLAMGSVSVPIGSVQIDGSPRLGGESDQHVRELAELDVPFAAILVHRPTMRVIDGAHRLRAAVLRGDNKIEVRFFDGNEADAFVLAVEANTTHGLPLSSEDRVAAATRILATHPEWSDRAIAASTGLSTKTVAGIRKCSTDSLVHSNSRLGRDGKVRPLDSSEARRRAGELIEATPKASLREIASAVGISPATVSDVRARLNRGEDPVPIKHRPARRTPAHGTVGATTFVAERGGTVRNLQRDPALRSSEMGRALLRLLNAQLIEVDTRERLVTSVPPHCAELVARAARECAAVWQEFADQVGKRSNATL